MSKRKRELSGEEKQLWRRVAETVRTRRTLPDAPAEEGAAPSPATKEQRTVKAEPSPIPKRAAAPPPQNRGGEKRVRRGKLEIGGSLDLHGHTQSSARAALARFLRSAQRRGDRTVIVVTGVGRGGEGVLKRALPGWLAEHDLRGLISGFAPAHRMHGGQGAFYVFLKRSAPES